MKKKPGRPKKLANTKVETPKMDLNKKEEENAIQTQETSDSNVIVEEHHIILQLSKHKPCSFRPRQVIAAIWR